MNISLLDSEFSGMDFAFKILGYGINGLIFLLLYLAYKLLSNEQKQKKPRENLLKSIYIFLSFSTILCILGFYLEYSKNGPINSKTDYVEFKGYESTDIKFSSLNRANSDLYLNQEEKVKTAIEEFFHKPKKLRELNTATLYSFKGKPLGYEFELDYKLNGNLIIVNSINQIHKEDTSKCPVELLELLSASTPFNITDTTNKFKFKIRLTGIDI